MRDSGFSSRNTEVEKSFVDVIEGDTILSRENVVVGKVASTALLTTKSNAVYSIACVCI